MALAMAVGMIAYSGLVAFVLTPERYEALQIQRPILWYWGMAPFMTVPMRGLMRRHGFTWRDSAEMSGAMLVPPAILVVGAASLPQWLGPKVSVHVHVVMFLSMLALMLYRRGRYSQSPSGPL